MSSSVHANNRTKNILVFCKDFIRGLAILYNNLWRKIVYINYTKTNTKFCLSLHCNGANSYLFLNGTEIHKFKAKDSEIMVTPLCLGNISKDFTVDYMKKTGLNECVYDFSVDYDAIANGKKQYNVKCLDLLKMLFTAFLVAIY